MALPQNSSNLTITTFLDEVLVCFELLAEVLIDQGKEFFRTFKVFYNKALINYYNASKDYFEIDDLAEWIV